MLSTSKPNEWFSKFSKISNFLNFNRTKMVCISKCIAFLLWKRRKGGVLDFTIFFLSERKIAFCCYQDTFAKKKNNSKLALNPWIRIKCKLTAHNKWNFVKNDLDAGKLKKGLSWHHCLYLLWFNFTIRTSNHCKVNKLRDWLLSKEENGSFGQ